LCGKGRIKKFIIVEKKLILFENEYQYDLHIEDGSKYKLYHNNSETWNSHTRGTLAFEMECDGNGYEFKTAKKGRLDYSEAVYMYLILSLEKNYKLEVANIEKEL
jgi:hypothetical protein